MTVSFEFALGDVEAGVVVYLRVSVGALPVPPGQDTDFCCFIGASDAQVA